MGLCPKPRFILFCAKKNEPRKCAPIKAPSFIRLFSPLPGNLFELASLKHEQMKAPLQLPSSPKLAK